MSESCGGGKQGHAPCGILLLQQSLFFVLILIEIARLSQSCGESDHLQFF